MKNIEGIYKKYIQELTKEYDIYKMAKSKPELILTDIYNPEMHQPFYNHMSHVLKSDGISLGDIQRHWIKLLQKYFNDLDDEIELRTQYNSVPTAFTILFKDEVLFNFSIYSHKFSSYGGITGRIKHLESYLTREKSRLPELEQKYSRYLNYQKNKFSMLKRENYSDKGLRRYLTVARDFCMLILKAKNIEKNLAQVVETNLKILEDQKKLINKVKKDIADLEEKRLEGDNKLKEWKKRLLDWGYEEKDKVYR